MKFKYIIIKISNISEIIMRKFILLFCVVIFLKYLSYSEEKELLLVTCQWPPFEYTETGKDDDSKQYGTDVEVINRVFENLNIKQKIVFLPWERCFSDIKNYKADGIFTLRKSPEREKICVYPKEVLSISENVFFYLKKSKKKYVFNNINDLKDLSIGITRGYAYGDEFMNSKLFKLDISKDDDLNFKKLLYDRIDLFICDKLVGLSLLKKADLTNEIDYLPNSLSKFDMYLAFSKEYENSELIRRYDKALSELKNSGEYDKIIQKYIKK